MKLLLTLFIIESLSWSSCSRTGLSWSEWSCVSGSWRRSASATQLGGRCGGQVKNLSSIDIQICQKMKDGNFNFKNRVIFLEDHISISPDGSRRLGRQTSKRSFWDVVFHKNKEWLSIFCSDFKKNKSYFIFVDQKNV